MKKMILIFSCTASTWLYVSSCNYDVNPDNEISKDPATIAKGKATFIQHCSGCHNFKQGGIGPPLGSVTDTVSVSWIPHFISNPKETIESGMIGPGNCLKNTK